MPYGAHAGAVMAPNTKPPGYDQIANHIVKKYDYMYTGLNTEVINFNIDFNKNSLFILNIFIPLLFYNGSKNYYKRNIKIIINNR